MSQTVLNLPGQVSVYIIVDTLDKCRNDIGSPSDRDQTLSFVQDLVESNLPNLFICVISRPGHDIGTILDPLTSSSSSCRISLHEEVGQREDINSYIDFFVRNQYEMRRWRMKTRNLLSTHSRNELLACEISLLQCLVIVIHAVGQVSMGALPVRHPTPMLALKYS